MPVSQQSVGFSTQCSFIEYLLTDSCQPRGPAAGMVFPAAAAALVRGPFASRLRPARPSVADIYTHSVSRGQNSQKSVTGVQKISNNRYYARFIYHVKQYTLTSWLAAGPIMTRGGARGQICRRLVWLVAAALASGVVGACA